MRPRGSADILSERCSFACPVGDSNPLVENRLQHRFQAKLGQKRPNANSKRRNTEQNDRLSSGRAAERVPKPHKAQDTA